ncbi:MAG: mechanosensitive ion channel family protein [Candidatus Magasanikbacteria bacterium]
MPLSFLSHYSLLGNTAYEYLIAGLIFLASLIVLKVFEKIVANRLKKISKDTDNNFDDVITSVIGNVGSLFYLVVSFFVAFQWITATSFIEKIVEVVFAVVVAREAINAVSRLVNFLAEKYLQYADQDVEKEHATIMVGMIRKTLVVVLWLIVGTFILSNFGINITSLVTGLGIGGIAIGIALQNVLADIFSSVSIFLDKPFVVGDFIQVGENMGTVEKIGIKSTRIETLRGEQLIIPNTELTSSRIQNYSKTEKIRDQITVGVSYDTSQETLREIPQKIQNIIEGMDEVTFDRCRLNSYGDSSINFKVVYFVNSISFADLDRKKEELNYAIYDMFDKEGVEFPFPTRTVHLKKESE